MTIRTRSPILAVIIALTVASACVAAPAPAGDESSESSNGGGTGAETGAGSETGEPPEPYTCNNPTEILQPGSEAPTGFVMCDDGFVHRVAQADAVVPNWPDDPECSGGTGPCASAADCGAEPYGACIYDPNQGCVCNYGCVTDADCDEGQICAPAGVAGPSTQCIWADCKTDADCGDGLCGLSIYDGCCAVQVKLQCAAPIEACHGSDDCGTGPCTSGPNGETSYFCVVQNDNGVEGKGEWTCKPPAWCECSC